MVIFLLFIELKYSVTSQFLPREALIILPAMASILSQFKSIGNRIGYSIPLNLLSEAIQISQVKWRRR
jgi:hypothetical protein